jgi:hypothetical protein
MMARMMAERRKKREKVGASGRLRSVMLAPMASMRVISTMLRRSEA